jgi:hypothetical protein
VFLLRVGREGCPHCGRCEVYVSKPESVWENLMILLLLQPVRCRGCLARFYRPLWMHTPTHPNHRSQRLSDKPVKIAAKLTSEGVHRE